MAYPHHCPTSCWSSCKPGCSEEAEEVVVDHSALLPQPAGGLRRKKKWHKFEDRELLTAWAG